MIKVREMSLEEKVAHGWETMAKGLEFIQDDLHGDFTQEKVTEKSIQEILPIYAGAGLKAIDVAGSFFADMYGIPTELVDFPFSLAICMAITDGKTDIDGVLAFAREYKLFDEEACGRYKRMTECGQAIKGNDLERGFEILMSLMGVSENE